MIQITMTEKRLQDIKDDKFLNMWGCGKRTKCLEIISHGWEKERNREREREREETIIRHISWR